EGIDLIVVQSYFVVQMRAGGTACRADVADHVAALHASARAHREAGKVAVARRIAVAMRDVDHIAVTVRPFRLHDDAVSGGAYGLADCGRDVDRVVRPRLAGERIGAPAEAVSEDAAH